MPVVAIFGINVLATFVSAFVAAWVIWPRLDRMERSDALAALVAPHMFFRFIGLSFLVPGVVSASLPAALAVPAAWGDLGAGILAIAAMIGLSRRASWATAAAWIFNVWGGADLLFAFFQGRHIGLDPGMLGAGYFIVTTMAPTLLVTHVLMFRVLWGVQGATKLPASQRELRADLVSHR